MPRLCSRWVVEREELSVEQDRPSPIFHIGIVVPDLRAAQEQLGKALGLTWGEWRRERYGDWELQAVTSVEGPPHLELQQGSPGSPWDAKGQARFDHIQRWSTDLASDMAEMTGDGMAVDVDGADLGLPFCYLRTEGGLRVELIDDKMRPQFRSISRLDGPER
jgi:hypothetical protein